jgi:hypothetical protein
MTSASTGAQDTRSSGKVTEAGAGTLSDVTTRASGTAARRSLAGPTKRP